MISEAEKKRLDAIRDEVLKSAQIQFQGIELTDEMLSEIVGRNLGLFDGLFAIREGESWRGMSDPKEIARVLLREAAVGD